MSLTWSVPPIWLGQTVAILASGPSLTRHDAEVVRQARLPAVVTNTTYQLAPWADLLVANDSAWWSEYPRAHEFKGLRFSASELPGRDVLSLRITGAEGYDPDPSCVRTGGNSGYTAMHIAAQAGANRIILLGFDMRGINHWHGSHPASLRRTYNATFARWLERFETLAPELRKRSIEVVNCTPGSALECFPRSILMAELAAQGKT